MDYLQIGLDAFTTPFSDATLGMQVGLGIGGALGIILFVCWPMSIPGLWGWPIEKLIKLLMVLGCVFVGVFLGAIIEAWHYGLR